MGSDATFSVVRKGYDTAQVDSHLRSLRLAGHQGNDELEARIVQLEAELAEARKREEAVQITLVAATKTRKEMLEAAQIELSQAAHQARTSADDIVSEAQFEAFRLVTRAKKDAEATINAAQEEASVKATHAQPAPPPVTQDAAAVREAVEAQARAKIEEMQIEALSTIHEIREEAEEVIASRDARITQLLTQIDATGPTASSIEAPIASTIESASAEPPAPVPIPPDSAVGDEQEDRTQRRDRDAGRPAASDVLLEDSDAMPLSDRPVRGSFYSRRSARLPRIGTEAANGAVAAVNAMRAKSRDNVEERAEGEPGDAEEDMAMQSA